MTTSLPQLSARPHPRVIVVTGDQPYVEVSLLRGIGHYGAKHGFWQVLKIPHDRPAFLSQIRHLHGQGIIHALWDPATAAELYALKLPLVTVLGHYPELDIPTVIFDNRQLGRIGAEHLLAQGFQRFAFYGSSLPYSLGREQGFVERLSEAGFTCRTTGASSHPRQRPTLDYLCRPDVLENWLRRLERPVAVMASDDTLAAMILNVCEELGWRVPDDVAILGVNNDELDCCYGTTPLSSVDLDVEQIGYRAAEMLHRLMRGEKNVEKHVVLPPLGVVARRSTERLAFGDPDLTTAIHFLRQHAGEGLSVAAVEKETPVSRKTLERLFRRHLNCTPKEEIMRVRLERVRELLVATTLPMVSIAVETGFKSISHLCKAFVRKFGVSPRTYRMQKFLRQDFH